MSLVSGLKIKELVVRDDSNPIVYLDLKIGDEKSKLYHILFTGNI